MLSLLALALFQSDAPEIRNPQMPGFVDGAELLPKRFIPSSLSLPSPHLRSFPPPALPSEFESLQEGSQRSLNGSCPPTAGPGSQRPLEPHKVRGSSRSPERLNGSPAQSWTPDSCLSSSLGVSGPIVRAESSCSAGLHSTWLPRAAPRRGSQQQGGSLLPLDRAGAGRGRKGKVGGEQQLNMLGFRP